MNIHVAALVVIFGVTVGSPSLAASPGSDLVTLTLQEAVQLALASNFAVRDARLNQRDAVEVERAGFAAVLPRLDSSVQYTRNVLANDPFAGTGAGGSFGALGSVGWLQFNEAARTDDQPATLPISLAEYQRRSIEGLSNAGIDPTASQNLFLVENQIRMGLNLTQVIYDDGLFASLDALDLSQKLAAAGLDTQSLAVVQQVSISFYGSLLAAEQAGVLRQSVERASSNVKDTRARVEVGQIAPFQQVTAEVELANLQTSLVRAEAAATTAKDQLRLLIGMPPTQQIALRGQLTSPSAAPVLEREAAVSAALSQRPDVAQAELLVEANEVQKRVARGRFIPRVSAFANLSYNGNIPDDRSVTVTGADPNDPFAVQVQNRGIFADEYWFPVFNFGVLLSWNLFEGFAAAAQHARSEIATERSQLQADRLRLAVRLEVERSLRDLETAQKQLATQERVRERATRNYEEIKIRVAEGVSTQFDLRQASDQLDQTRFNQLQAVHDTLVAKVNYMIALGTPSQDKKDSVRQP